MNIVDVYRLKSPYREDFLIKGYSFGKGQQAACILGPVRGNEVQQIYICSQLVKVLKELEANGAISSNKQIMVIPCVNPYSMNVGKRFFGVNDADINRMFPGNDYVETTSRIAAGVMDVITV